MSESSRLPAAVRRALSPAAARRLAASLAPAVPAHEGARPLGAAAIDQALGGGLATGRLHELFARDPASEASAMGFAAMCALCVAPGGAQAAPILWLREEAAQRRAALNGPGLADLGLDPARLILGVLPDVRAVLRASVDALGCAGLGALVVELSGNPPLLDLTASRRLALAAESSGVTPLLLRLRGGAPSPSAAQTRWEVAPVPSRALEADAPGLPALAVALLRQRGGPAGLDWIVEWDRDAAAFRPASLPGAGLSLPRGGPVPAAGSGPGAGWRLAG